MVSTRNDSCWNGAREDTSCLASEPQTQACLQRRMAFRYEVDGAVPRQTQQVNLLTGYILNTLNII